MVIQKLDLFAYDVVRAHAHSNEYVPLMLSSAFMYIMSPCTANKFICSKLTGFFCIYPNQTI